MGVVGCFKRGSAWLFLCFGGLQGCFSNPGKGDTGSNWSGGSGEGEKWSHSGCIYKAEPIEVPDVLGRRHETETETDESRTIFRTHGWSNWESAIA